MSLFAFLMLGAHFPASGQDLLKEISGQVLDSNGAAIPNAVIVYHSQASTTRTVTDAQGHFKFATNEITGTLSVSATGFATNNLSMSVQNAATQLHITLQPAGFIERIDVALEQDRVSRVAESEFAISKRELEASGAVTVDEVSRQVPGFSLFRRSSSLYANPTAQGVSLRGVGASGASRALVLVDGIPLNSPFGGWIYWNRIPRTSIQVMEVHNGAVSDLYGSGALGGVVNITTQSHSLKFFDAEASFGNENTPSVSISGGTTLGPWGLDASGQGLRTDGYVAVPEDQRGTVDTPVATADLAGSISLTRRLAGNGKAFLRFNSFGESRKNGTPIQVNDTSIWSLDLGADFSLFDRNELSFRLYGSSEALKQNFSAVALDRNSESLTNQQRNPSQQFGLALQWRRSLGTRQTIVGGLETHDVRGHSAEITFNNSRITAHVDSGGRQNALGVFGQDSLRFGSWVLNLGGRVDYWRNRDGFSQRIPATGPATQTSFLDRSEVLFSPRVSVVKHFGDAIFTSASVYRSFRAPTLNELYRGFRVGNVVTNANADLHAERLTGGDAGLGFQTLRQRLFVRGNFFWTVINDSVANVTLSTTPALITRQRQNLGATRARGIELAASLNLNSHWQVTSEYLLVDSTVLHFPANRALEGLKVPQIPSHQFNFQTSYYNRDWTAGLQGRFNSLQYDDDQNLLPLEKFFVVDAHVARSLSSKVQLLASVQNVTGIRYQTSKTPVLTVGPPLLFRVGVKVSWNE